VERHGQRVRRAPGAAAPLGDGQAGRQRDLGKL